MSRRKPAGRRRRPALEINGAMRAGQIRYQVPPGTRTRTQGVRRADHTSRRDGMPQMPERGARYTEVSTSFRAAAWLEGDDDGEVGHDSEVEDGKASH